MSLNDETLRVGKDRITRIFRYLEALNQHRNPAKRQISEQLWVLRLSTLPDHPSIQKGIIDESSDSEPKSATRANSNPANAADDFILKVRRPSLTHAPSPPEVIATWLERGWDDPFAEIRVRESQNHVNERGETQIVRFEEDSERPRALEIWRTRWNEWSRNEIPTRKALKTFEQLYELHGRIEREAERVEVVLGDGILSWRRQEGGVFHPVLLQRLQLQFNPTIPEFTLVESEHEVELYSALFQSMADVDGKAIGRCREELKEGNYHPLGGEDTSGFLKRLVIQFSPRGEFIGENRLKGENNDPCISRDPVIFLRARTLGFATAIEAVLEDLRNRQDLPSSLVNIVGIDSQQQEVTDDIPCSEPGSPPGDILFSKESNPEQIRIAEQLERHGNVLVQGPPGTGKSHTIANLIGHLLAQGKSVLVTSHTTKALRVLRGHVVEKLRPLCVSALESDIESRSQLESSVRSIVERLSTSNKSQLDTEASTLGQHRKELLEKRRKLSQELLQARGDEYRDIIIAGQSYAVSEAARKVAQQKEINDWTPAPITVGAALPLSQGELIDLYRINAVLSSDDELELNQELPNPKQLKTPEDFNRMIEERRRLAALPLNIRPDLWDLPVSEQGLESLESVTEEIRKAVVPIGNGDSWKLAVITAGRNGERARATWDNLLSMVAAACEEAEAAQEILLRHGPNLCDDLSLEQQEEITDEIIRHLEHGGKLSRLKLMLRPSWNQILQGAKVGNGSARTIDHFRALKVLVRLKMRRLELGTRWDRQVAALGGPSAMEFGEEPEKACAQFSSQISRCLGWYSEALDPVEQKLKSLGFRWESFTREQPPNVTPHGDLQRLLDAIANVLRDILVSRANAIRMCRLNAKTADLLSTIAYANGGQWSSAVLSSLKEAITSLNPASYAKAFQRLVMLHNLRVNYERRHGLLTRLEQVAPAWAAVIRDRRGVHSRRDIPGDAASAWLWRQLHDELDRRGKTSLEQLQQSIQSLSEELQRVTAELIDRRAWAAQLGRTTLQQRQALIGWLDTIKKIGKGYGKRVTRLRAVAAQKMSECRTSVPVWIMPLSRVAENFDPRGTRFDVLIIDESSQSDVMGLLAFYLAKEVVVVGDHEQVSPVAVGQKLEIVQHLIDEHLQEIPNAHLYDGQMSVYDLARQSFGGAICLLEHFRCVPEIIEFSNQLSYDGSIKPLRDPSLVQLKPHVIGYRVNGSSSDNKVNREEAWTVASVLVAASEQPEYKDKTFGAISLVGEEQAREVEQILLRHFDADEYKRHRILCGNAAQFQGDERDVMFLSVVDTSLGDGPLAFRDQPMFKQRFNVAASRARDQMWVVYSLDPKRHLKAGDLRRRLIEHAEDPYSLLRSIEKSQQKAESEFEKAVLRKLIQAGYRVVPQWKAGYYRIDIVVEGGGKRLAIECDGDRFHPIEKLQEDMTRQAILERLGWIFCRIRGSQFFRNPDAAMEPVFRRLEHMAIPPEGPDPDASTEHALGEELKQRIIRRADELRRIWEDIELPFDNIGARPNTPGSRGARLNHFGSNQEESSTESGV